jgi:Predicted membrane protein
MKPVNTQPISASSKLLTSILFGSRWLQVPLYLGLIGAQLVYVVHFMVELQHLVMGTFNLGEEAIMLIVLGLIDVVMISNLLIMVIVGGYETFVSRLNWKAIPTNPNGCRTSTPTC